MLNLLCFIYYQKQKTKKWSKAGYDKDQIPLKLTL